MPNFLKSTASICLVFLLVGCASSISRSTDDKTQRILLRDTEIHVPSEMVIDLRLLAKHQVLTIRAAAGDGFSPKSIGISFDGIDDEAERVFQDIGYELRKVCDLRVFTMEGPNAGRSVVIALEQAMIVLTRIAESHERRILRSICDTN